MPLHDQLIKRQLFGSRLDEILKTVSYQLKTNESYESYESFVEGGEHRTSCSR